MRHQQLEIYMNNNHMSDTVTVKNFNNKQETSTVVNSTVSDEKNSITTRRLLAIQHCCNTVEVST
jgi:hypothetical protein